MVKFKFWRAAEIKDKKKKKQKIQFFSSAAIRSPAWRQNSAFPHAHWPRVPVIHSTPCFTPFPLLLSQFQREADRAECKNCRSIPRCLVVFLFSPFPLLLLPLGLLIPPLVSARRAFSPRVFFTSSAQCRAVCAASRIHWQQPCSGGIASSTVNPTTSLAHPSTHLFLRFSTKNCHWLVARVSPPAAPLFCLAQPHSSPCCISGDGSPAACARGALVSTWRRG